MSRISLRQAFVAATFVVACVSTIAVVNLRATASQPAPSESTTKVEIKSEHLTGYLPIGLLVDVNVKVTAEGDDASSLVGEGRHFASTGAHNYWPVTGSTDGTLVVLSGVVTDSNAVYLIGSPVDVVGSASTGDIVLTFGPLAGGPFVGKTLEFSGTGKVTITNRD